MSLCLPFQLPSGIEEAGFKQETEENVQVLLGWLSLHPALRPRAEGVMTSTECISGLPGALASSEPAGAKRTQVVPLPGALPPGDVAVTRSHPKGPAPSFSYHLPLFLPLSLAAHVLHPLHLPSLQIWGHLPRSKALGGFTISCPFPLILSVPTRVNSTFNHLICFHRDPG